VVDVDRAEKVKKKKRKAKNLSGLFADHDLSTSPSVELLYRQRTLATTPEQSTASEEEEHSAALTETVTSAR